MKRIVTTIALVLTFCGMAQAVVVQRVYLKNGSVLNGYIESAADGMMTVRTDSALVIVDGKNVSATITSQIPEADLHPLWRSWAERNDAYVVSGEKKTLTLSNFSLHKAETDTLKSVPCFSDYLILKGNITGVRVLEDGVQLKYLELTPNSYLIRWSDVEEIRADRRPRTILTGINRNYQLRNGESYNGQYAGESENTLALYMADGKVQRFNLNDVIKYTYVPIYDIKKVSFFEQSELLDIVDTKSGTPYVGVIREENYSSKMDSENYVVIEQENGATQTIKMAEVTGLRKKENSKYRLIEDVILKEGIVMINHKEAKPVGITEQNGNLVLDSLNYDSVVPFGSETEGTAVTVEYTSETGTNVERYKLVKVTRELVKQKDKKRTVKPVYRFSYGDIVNSVYRPRTLDTSVNNTTKAEYVVNGKGVFILYDAKNKQAIPFIVKN